MTAHTLGDGRFYIGSKKQKLGFMNFMMVYMIEEKWKSGKVVRASRFGSRVLSQFDGKGGYTVSMYPFDFKFLSSHNQGSCDVMLQMRGYHKPFNSRPSMRPISKTIPTQPRNVQTGNRYISSVQYLRLTPFHSPSPSSATSTGTSIHSISSPALQRSNSTTWQ